MNKSRKEKLKRDYKIYMVLSIISCVLMLLILINPIFELFEINETVNIFAFITTFFGTLITTKKTEIIRSKLNGIRKNLYDKKIKFHIKRIIIALETNRIKDAIAIHNDMIPEEDEMDSLALGFILNEMRHSANEKMQVNYIKKRNELVDYLNGNN